LTNSYVNNEKSRLEVKSNVLPFNIIKKKNEINKKYYYFDLLNKGRYKQILKKNLFKNYKSKRFLQNRKINIYKKINNYKGIVQKDIEFNKYESNVKLIKNNKIYNNRIKIMGENKLLGQSITKNIVENNILNNTLRLKNMYSNTSLFSKYFDFIINIDNNKKIRNTEGCVLYKKKKLIYFLYNKKKSGIDNSTIEKSNLTNKVVILKILNNLNLKFSLQDLINYTVYKAKFLKRIKQNLSKINFLHNLDYIFNFKNNNKISGTKIGNFILLNKYIEIFKKKDNITGRYYGSRLDWELKLIWWFILKIEKRIVELKYIEST
jgi:hypothetical protein